MIKKLIPYISKYKLYAFLAPLSIIIEVLLEIRIPYLMAKIVDVGIANKDIGYVFQTGMMMILMALLALIFGVMSAVFSAKAGTGFGSELRKAEFDKIQNFSFSNIDRFSTASLVTRLTTDVNNAQNALMMLLRIAVRAPVMLISATFMTYSINNSLVGVFLTAIPLLAITIAVIAVKTYPRFRDMLKNFDAMNKIVQENLIASRVVKSFVREKHEKSRFSKSVDDLMNASIRAEKLLVFNMPVMQLSMYGCIIAILWFGGNMVINEKMLSGELISFISYITQILMSLMMISMILINVILSRASIQRIIEVLEEKPSISNNDSKDSLKPTNGAIEFKNVFFKYNDKSDNYVLENINFKIKSGEKIGIIGGTGSSKTTLVQLVPRLYEASEGEIFISDNNIKDYTLENLRDEVSMVLQKNVLFSGTIKENLKWGNLEASDEEIIEACKHAQAHDFIMSFPDGYDTYLGQGGVNVSGGQKQRLCIARALLKKPKILILDDSTSAVDTYTDKKIKEALKNNLSDTTILMIAQRISSIEDADRIIIIDDGKINDIGTHSELFERNPIYQEIYLSQQKGVA